MHKNNQFISEKPIGKMIQGRTDIEGADVPVGGALNNVIHFGRPEGCATIFGCSKLPLKTVM